MIPVSQFKVKDFLLQCCHFVSIVAVDKIVENQAYFYLKNS